MPKLARLRRRSVVVRQRMPVAWMCRRPSIVSCVVLGMLLVSSGYLSAGERMAIELHDGSRVEGEILKKDADGEMEVF